ncbi:hypothetical protein KM427_19985 [Nocardioides sp. LMS-CY]|uniref:hypothetical protein n=1 Tax=Nocardioides sp. (strain LMS-CY) TaxID=2840457 RepID=UPI001C003162|nr:hypothetical protein [Nocardioides sp. LMS-CY]QWF21202.1 hypothetical protein KM427_19985 [Nocardioides sp. LMS-CY]
MSTTSMPTHTERPSGRHPVNVGHLVMGIAFLGLVGIWAVIQADGVDNDDIRWLLPIPWVLAGLAGLLALSVSSRHKWSTKQVGWVETPPAAPVAETYESDVPGAYDEAAEAADTAVIAEEPAESPEPTESPESPEENR